jgi:protein phosphatase
LHGTNLPLAQLLLRRKRFATFAVVADGVGGSASGAAASQRAVETIAHYVNRRCGASRLPIQPTSRRSWRVQGAALEAHKAVRALGGGEGSTGARHDLTLALGIWPRAYVLQVGDSRCYVYGGGALRTYSRSDGCAGSARQWQVDS